LFPTSITVLPVVHGVIFLVVLLFATGFYLSAKGRSWKTTREEKQFYFAISFMVLVVMLVTPFSSLAEMADKNLGKFIFLLMAIPVYHYFRASRIHSSALWYGLVLGAGISAVTGIYDLVFDNYRQGYIGRASGATHPIIFGDLALLIGVLPLVGMGWFYSRSRWQVVLPLAAMCLGILASILSASRGGWVAIPVFAAVLIWASREQISRKLQVLGVGALLAILVAGYLIPQTGMRQKIQMTVENIQDYAESEVNDSRRATSIGSRFEMWQASWQIFLQHPLKGVGWGGYRQHAQLLVDEGLRNPSAASYPHPHNQFLSAMVNGGIVGIIAVVLLFYLPARIFFRAFQSPGQSDEVRRMALAGLLLMVVFAIFNLSESFLERSRTVAFFIFYLAIFMAGIREDKQLD
jgi:O-antigen ligase